MLASRSVHAKLEARITLWYIQCESYIYREREREKCSASLLPTYGLVLLISFIIEYYLLHLSMQSHPGLKDELIDYIQDLLPHQVGGIVINFEKVGA